MAVGGSQAHTSPSFVGERSEQMRGRSRRQKFVHILVSALKKAIRDPHRHQRDAWKLADTDEYEDDLLPMRCLCRWPKESPTVYEGADKDANHNIKLAKMMPKSNAYGDFRLPIESRLEMLVRMPLRVSDCL